MQSTTDRGYYNLLGHLSRPTTVLPLQTIQASISHYLANVQPTPTPFVALVISSPLFQHSLPASSSVPTSSFPSLSSSSVPAPSKLYAALQALSTSFRHATHLKITHLSSKPSTIFSRPFQSRVDEWVHAVLIGLQGGLPVFRLACACGLLLGLQDWEADLKLKEKEGKTRRKVEEEVVVSLAEVLDLYPYLSSASHWNSEFKGKAVEGMHAQPWGDLILIGITDTLLTITLLAVSTCLPLIAPHRLKALQLQVCIPTSYYQPCTHFNQITVFMRRAHCDDRIGISLGVLLVLSSTIYITKPRWRIFNRGVCFRWKYKFYPGL